MTLGVVAVHRVCVMKMRVAILFVVLYVREVNILSNLCVFT